MSMSPTAWGTAPARPPLRWTCTSGSPRRPAGGCVGLISSGTSRSESAFYDASENGDDVFFDTTGRLVTEDYDKAYDLYDAHVCVECVPCRTAGVSAAAV